MSYPHLQKVKQHIESGQLQSALSILRQIETEINDENEIDYHHLMNTIGNEYKSLKNLQSQLNKSKKEILKLILLNYKFELLDANESIIQEYISQYNINDQDLKTFNKLEQSHIYNCFAHFFYDKNSYLAIQLFQKELIHNPQSSNAHLAISELLFRKGNCSIALKHIKQAIEINPQNKELYNNYIMMLHYDEISLESIFHIAKEYENISIKNSNYNPISYSSPKFKAKNTQKLNIGFVSGDFRRHALFSWLADFLQDSNFTDLNLFLYHNYLEDEYSQKYQDNVKNWRNLHNINTEEAIQIIKNDDIDILIDLSGHTRHNRLDIFLHRAAPLQMTWLGQAGPIGLSNIDYMIVGKHLVREEEYKFYTEKILELNSINAPYSLKQVPSNIEQTRKLENKFILGSINNQIKINSKTLEAWSQILLNTENTELYIKNKSLDDPSTREELSKFFINKKIDTKRIKLLGHSDKKEYFQFFNSIDLLLDSFPVGGGTTCLDALYMGTPILTLYGKQYAHRFTSSLHKILGLDNLISYNIEEYINKAISFASAPEEIFKYKQTISNKFINSPICNTQEFTKDFVAKLNNKYQELMLNN